VVYEQQHHRGRAATESALGCVATIQMWCEEWKINHTAVHSATLKLFATGSGRASKEDMLKAGHTRFQPTSKSHDEIDALWIHAWAQERFGG